MKLTMYQLGDVLAELCPSCKKDCDREARYRDHVYMPGCYPWQCIHATVELKDHPVAGVRNAVKDNAMAFTPCPLTQVSSYKGPCLGCPKMNKDGTGEFCDCGVRRVDLVPEGSGRCWLGHEYEFKETADLSFGGVGYILHYTKIEKKLNVDPGLCVRVFARDYPPASLKRHKDMTSRDYNTIVRRMSVYGYDEKDGVWRKRTVEEQNEWVACCRYRLEWIKHKASPDERNAEATQAQNQEN